MKEQILKLHAEGKSYNEIQLIVGCSKSTISYHCGTGQKEKNLNRTRQRRKNAVISERVERFSYKKKFKDKSEDFQRERIRNKGKQRLGKRIMSFTWHDVIEKFGWETTCYLTGKPINLKEPKTYHFDHKIPYSKNGTSDIDNLGIACKEANVAKNDLMLEEFLELCKAVLIHNGYEVSNPKSKSE